LSCEYVSTGTRTACLGAHVICLKIAP
jgi:hypothetical protein